MRGWLHGLASLKLTVLLLVMIVVALAAGTIVESRSGVQAARAVYYGLWFYALLGVFALNLIAAIVLRWPWGRFRIGFVMTHSSMVLIFVGSLISHFAGISGSLPLWEGEEQSTFQEQVSREHQRPRSLPFSVRLDSFEIDVYPGTQRPAMFRSRVQVTDPASGETFPAVIQMNQELAYHGYRLFQSSYRIEQGREMTILSVSKDPGQAVVFVGYFLLMAGMVTVLTTRIVVRRAATRRAEEQAIARAAEAVAGGPSAAHGAAASHVAPASDGNEAPPGSATARGRAVTAVLLLGLLGLLTITVAATWAAPLPDPAAVDALRELPVQNDGRIMPLDTMARSAVRDVTGSETWNGLDPVAVVLGWGFSSIPWSQEPMVRLGNSTLATQLQLPGRSHASYHDLVSSGPMQDIVGLARMAQRQNLALNKVQEAALELESRLMTMNAFITNSAFRVIPNLDDPVAKWEVLSPLRSIEDLVAYQNSNTRVVAAGGARAEMSREILYNRVNPSRLAWWVLVPATLISLVAWRRPSRGMSVLAVLSLLAGFGVMTWGIGMRWQIAGRIPAANMYESMLFLAWGVGLFALIASIFMKNRLVIFNAAAMSALTMVLVDRLPIDPFIHPIAPVLAGTPWLAIHVPIIMVSYSVLTLGVLLAHMRVGLEFGGVRKQELVGKMDDLLYWYMHVGSILLIAGIITGSIWAASSWGRYWGWDPKEVWSLVAFLAYMGILHARFDRQIGSFGVAVASIAAFWMILMTYVGVNFVLASGLHSYGFGSSGVVRWMGLILAGELGFIGAAYLAYRRKSGRGHGARRTRASVA